MLAHTASRARWGRFCRSSTSKAASTRCPTSTSVRPSGCGIRMIGAVALAKIYGMGPVDRALATAAELGRFADEDLAQLIRHQATARPGKLVRLDESRSLQAGTSSWAGF